MRVLFLLLLPQLQLLPVLMAGVNTVSPDCTGECGDVSIPYPFGIGDGCFMPGFELTCNNTANNAAHDGQENNRVYTATYGPYKPFIGNVEVINISLQSGQFRIYNHISSSCIRLPNQTVSDENWELNFTARPYRFSNTLNKFTTVGCESLAYIISEKGNSSYQSGCLSVCRNNMSISDGRCSGMGCCQTSIPEGLNYYKVRFDERFDIAKVSNFNPCSYAFLVEEKKYKFDMLHVTTRKLSQDNGARVPIVVDWAIGHVHCDVARANRTTSYACLSDHSECLNSTNGPGYLCSCSSGYQGNPYLKNGCQDINECNGPKEEYPCSGICTNKPGSYRCDCFSGAQGNAYKGSCTCPYGTQGDPNVDGGCIPNPPSFRFPLWLILVIGIFCTFIAIAFAYLVFEKVKLTRMKQKYFRQNGGLLLKEKINAYQGAKFTIFTIKQMERATMNFHPGRELGKGGHGMVYKGILDNKRMVAIKKSMITGEKQTAQFINEMYISSLLNHKNVVKILGCCLEVEVPLLVYEFIPKGTLFDYIHNKEQRMSLDFCLKVATESAAALTYLHSYASPSILHCDVKSTNILLDDDLTPKLSDFGGSLRDDRESSYVHTTDGYRDPESFKTGETTQKSDVYSFAVVLLELITRRMVLPSNGTDLVSFFKSSIEEDGFADIFYDEVKCEFQRTQLEELTKLLKQCLSDKGKNRPTMKEVATRLERLREVLPQVKCIDEQREITLEESSSYHAEGISKSYSSENQNMPIIHAGR